MLDVKQLRNNPQGCADALAVKGYDLDIAQFTELEAQRRALQIDMENLQSERNSTSKKIGRAKSNGEDIQPLITQVGTLGERLESAKENFNALQLRLQDFLLSIPNLPDASVPQGKSEDDNVELRRWGQVPQFTFTPRDHVDLGANGDMDFAAAAKITGARYVVLHHQLARLHRALAQFMLDKHISEHGYREVYVPFIVNAQSLYGTGQLPKFAQDQFKVDADVAQYLIPTAEVPVTNIYRDSIVSEEALPIKHVCHTPCFRSEAGSHGRDTRGMIRQHQFEKVELVQLIPPEQSWQAFEELTSHAEAILQSLELPYRAVVLCGGDLGFSSAKTIDLEVWLPGQQTYREISSCSHFLDFQARRLQARYRKDGKPALLHTLNGSGLAVGRTLVAVLENYQDGVGKIAIPEKLQPYMGGMNQIELQPN